MIENPAIDDERLLRLSEVENMTGFKKSFIKQRAEILQTWADWLVESRQD